MPRHHSRRNARPSAWKLHRTHHASERSRQRSIPFEIAELAYEFGVCAGHRNCFILTKERVRELSGEAPELPRPLLRRALKAAPITTVVVDASAICTVYRPAVGRGHRRLTGGQRRRR